MRGTRIGAIVVTALFAMAATAARQGILEQHIGPMYGSKAGTDQDGHLWFWNSRQNTVTRVGSDGGHVTSSVLPAAVNVDADAKRGIAVLANDGDAIRVLTWDGRLVSEIDLPETAGDIAWLAGSLIAVTPKYADHRIAIWDLTTRTRIRTIDPCLPISRGNGTHIARATLIRYDRGRNEIVALDATFGRVFVFSGGDLVREARLPAPPTQIHEWLDADQRSEEIHIVTIWRFATLTITADGALWISGSTATSGDLRIFRISRDSKVQTLDVRVPNCVSSRVQSWGDALIVFADPRVRQSSCTAILDYESGLTAGERRLNVRYVGHPSTAGAAGIGVTQYPRFAVRPNASMCFYLSDCANVCACGERPGYHWTATCSCAKPDSGCLFKYCIVQCTYYPD